MTESSFYESDPGKRLKDYIETSSSDWQKRGEQTALATFREAALRVPAYKNFLQKHKINPEKIKTIEDFKLLPLVDKKNYLTQYPLNELALDGKLDKLYMLSSSSGSTGTPFLWPRGSEQEIEGALFAELFYKYLFGMDSKSTLYVVSFGMGTWIAGTFMSSVTQLISKKGYPITVMTPGLEKDLLLTLIKNLKGSFSQVVIIGYPPFVKDILDSGKEFDLDWKSIDLKLMFAAEGFTEQWRNYVLNKIGSKNALKSTTNIYGTADAGIMGMETPLSILFRRVLVNKGRVEDFFGQTRQPTFIQYDPTQKFFEKVGNELVFTSNSGLPLIRYNIHDNGNIVFYEQIEDYLGQLGISLKEELSKSQSDLFDWKLPFLYIFGRTDFMVNFYGLGIFPEHIKSGLEDPRVSNLTTGKFTMHTETDKRHNQKLILQVELQREIQSDKSLEKLVASSVIDNLKKLNSEYSKLYKELGNKKATPKIYLQTYGDHRFKIGAKHKWVKK